MQARVVARWALALIYLAAGVLHLAVPDVFLSIMPHWVPYPRLVVLGTGVAEIAGAIALLTGRWQGRWQGRVRRAAGIGLALYAVCVVPANIKHAIDGLPVGAIQLGWWYHGPRLALQPVLVWWALFVGEVIGARAAGGENPPPPAVAGGWGERIHATFVRYHPSPCPLPQGEGENFLPPVPLQITPSACKAAISASVLPSKPL